VCVCCCGSFSITGDKDEAEAVPAGCCCDCCCVGASIIFDSAVRLGLSLRFNHPLVSMATSTRTSTVLS
jgi:hypothetical protein